MSDCASRHFHSDVPLSPLICVWKVIASPYLLDQWFSSLFYLHIGKLHSSNPQPQVLNSRVTSFLLMFYYSLPDLAVWQLSFGIEMSTHLQRMLATVAGAEACVLEWMLRCVRQRGQCALYWWRVRGQTRATVFEVKPRVWARGVQTEQGKGLVLRTPGPSGNTDSKGSWEFALWEGWGLPLTGGAYTAWDSSLGFSF